MTHYKIQVLDIGYDPSFPAGIAFDFWHMQDKQFFSPFSMTLIQGENRNILFDCGMDTGNQYVASKISAEGDCNCHTPVEVLETAGLYAEDIDAVILSHCHWDHMSGIRFFPNAKVFIQRKEVDSWKRTMADRSFPCTYKSVIDAESLNTLELFEQKGNVVYLDEDVDALFPGISIRMASGHSYAQNMLFIESGSAAYAVIGDVAMRSESFTGTDLFPCFLPNLKFAVGTIGDIVNSYSAILDWVKDDVSHIIMSHDGTRADVWPTIKSRLGLNITTVCN